MFAKAESEPEARAVVIHWQSLDLHRTAIFALDSTETLISSSSSTPLSSSCTHNAPHPELIQTPVPTALGNHHKRGALLHQDLVLLWRFSHQGPQMYP